MEFCAVEYSLLPADSANGIDGKFMTCPNCGLRYYTPMMGSVILINCPECGNSKTQNENQTTS